MKPAAFDYVAADTLAAAAASGARIIAGGQSLGPMLNLRIAQPAALVGITNIPALQGYSETATHIVIGAATTHAQIEDGLTPDIGAKILASIAANIAYRAVRNRGTIGGSLCHADPAADWPTTLTALNAQAITTTRTIPLQNFFTAPFTTTLTPGEILIAIKIPKLTHHQKFGYHKSYRKPGEFAYAMAAILTTPTTTRIVIGALATPPLLLENTKAQPEAIANALKNLPPIARQQQLTAIKRAFENLAP